MMEQVVTPKEMHVLLSYPTRAEAESVKAYLVKELRVASDLGIEIEHRKSSWGKGMVFALMVDSYFKSFSTSVQKCHDAARDYCAGLRNGRQEAEEGLLRAWRGTLSTRAYRGIKPLEWADPVGRAAGLTCKRVGTDKDGNLFLRMWKCADGTPADWKEAWSQDTLETWLSKEDMLPFPTWFGDE
jgi:hypothetical protein